jgi:transcriptional regulator with XRE-family HTH domain
VRAVQWHRQGAHVKPGLTAGAEAFALLARRFGAAEVARQLKRTPGAVSNWAAGRRAPTAAVRRAIAKRYAVDPSLWDTPRPPNAAATLRQPAPAVPSRKPVDPRKARRAATHAPAQPEEAGGEEAAESVARDTVRRLRRELDRLDSDPEATSRERASVSTALTSATRLLARLSGALELSPSQILRSQAWRTIVVALVDALRPIPGACDAAAKCLGTFGGDL